MNQKPVRVRFAPSPTGHLHVGGARTAIFNWLFAKRSEGKFIVRVEDTDQARSTRESERMVLDDLRWLGLGWDEGPEIGGPHAPYRQSERRELYDTVANALLDKGAVYRCFCSEELLEEKRKRAETESKPPHYDLTCAPWNLSSEDIARQLERKTPFALRFHVHSDADVTINDLIRGEVTWRRESLGDFIIIRSDGMPTYNFSVVADDHDMSITHVIRAEEHLTNTHRQVLIYRAMEWTVPEFAHVSLILGQDRTKLSKRHGATSVAAYAEEGFLPEAMLNYLALLGWSTPDGLEVFSRQYATENFSFDRVNSAPAVFDPKKFEWLNGQYIHRTSPADLRRMLADRFRKEGWLLSESASAASWIEEAIELVQKGMTKLNDFPQAMRFLFDYDVSLLMAVEENRLLLQDEETIGLLRLLAQDMRAEGQPGSSEAYHSLAERLKAGSGKKGKALFMPIRLAVTGTAHGPELHRTFPLLERGSRTEGLARVLSPLDRVDALLSWLGG